MAEETILKVEHVNKYFHEPKTFQVLKDVSFGIAKGELVAVTGKSGSGKSSLLYVISTLDTDFEGSLEINGEDLVGKSENKLAAFRNEHIGFIFQFHYLLPEFTALQNVMLPAMKRKKLPQEEIEEKALHLLDMLNIKAQALKQTNKLSGGEQQRVALARAMVNDPAIIMGDEPTGNLDSINSQLVFDILKDLAKEQNQTIIMITHDEDLANKCDRILEMRDGVLLH